ncbi:dipeptide/oligopeptide/nickel ABC transporter permease/ATP-binding protein [Corynebacterium auris]|uniref:dipeptide/oligopeptide/nickel ABC transporter permease/ATP-binding protein n=1 Tax=Corynebacterium auris TaxID=44750 RepID=UPI003F493FB1
MRDTKARKLSNPNVSFRLGGWGRMNLGSKISLIVLVLIALAALFAPLLAPHDPTAIDFKGQAPDSTYWFGTDNLGRDVFSRVLYGARYSLAVGLLATFVALIFGVILGSIAAVGPKWLSEVVMRILDVIMSVPGIALVAITVVVFRDPQRPFYMLGVIIMSIAFVYIPQLTRIVRANVLAEYGEDYVRAAVVSGARSSWILARHVARNCAAPVLVFATVLVADAIILEASLTFIGAGLQEPVPTWGNILSSAQQGVLRGDWWQALFPGLAIMITVLCLNILSEGITDAMVAAPRASAVPATQADAKREEDRLLANPVEAYAQQRDALASRLEALRGVESQRGDRFLPAPGTTPLLEVQDLCIRFPRHGSVNVVDNVNYAVAPGETMGIVGESGCGKSITNLAVMGLLDDEAEVTGRILYKGTDLLALSKDNHRALLGHDIAMIYQDALSALNPSMLIRTQLKQLTKRGGTRSARELLELVGLDPERTLASYPHELSGGQRQRVLIAMALTRDPALVIADEPTTALDVTVQKQVIELLKELQDKLGFALVFISHDLALVAEVAHSVTVMYAGQVVEQGSTVEILTDPRHEYTRGLLGSVLSIEAGGDRLHQVPGTVPSPAEYPSGDRFAPRSSHPSVGLQSPPVMRNVPGTNHYYVDLLDELKPAAELERQGRLDKTGLTDQDYAEYAASLQDETGKD